MIVEKHHVEGYENFLDFMKKFESNETVFVFYIGTKLPNGYSWCPDCVDGNCCTIVIYFIYNLNFMTHCFFSIKRISIFPCYVFVLT